MAHLRKPHKEYTATAIAVANAYMRKACKGYEIMILSMSH